MSWASRRKTNYILGILLFIFIFVVLPVSIYLYKKPTCSDNKLNQGEAGIDCGGPCRNLCRAQYSDPNFLWARWAKVKSSGLYSVLMYIENPNIEAGVSDVKYRFKLRDSKGILLYEGQGVTSIPPNKVFAIIESNINLNDKIPGRPVELEFLPGAVWQKVPSKEQGITTVSKTMMNEFTKPKLSTTLKNVTLKTIKEIEVIAILYDVNDNAFAFSKSFVDLIEKDSSVDVFFTWPEPLESKVYRIEVIPKVLE